MIKLVSPDADSKLSPLITLLLLFVPAGKSMPLRVLLLLLLVLFVKAILMPLTVVDVLVVLLSVTPNVCADVAFVPEE